MKLFKIALCTAATLFMAISVRAQSTSRRFARPDSGVSVRKTDVMALRHLAKDYQKTDKKAYRKARRYARQNDLPLRKVSANGKILELQRLDARGKPVYYTTFTNAISSSDAAVTTGTNQAWENGTLGLQLNGSHRAVAGKLGVWEGSAVRRTHQELTGRVTQQDDAGSDNAEETDHATHVSGIMAASGVNPRAKGMAYQAQLKAWDWNNDASETSTAAGGGLLLSNHSYGLGNVGWVYNPDRPGTTKWEWWGDTDVDAYEDYRFGHYDEEAQRFDQIALNAPDYLIVFAAGNNRSESGPTDSSAYYLNSSFQTSTLTRRRQDDYDLISSVGTAKNVLTVGAIATLPDGYRTASNVSSAYFSAWGPTDDGRIKPDVVGAGVNIYASTATSDVSYASYSGTSMAAPNVTGSLLLLQEHYANVYDTTMRAATLKGLVLHTANEVGDSPGPDYRYGWGLLNTAKAAQVISDVDSTHRILERNLAQNDSYTFRVFASGSGPLVGTLSWTDPAATPLSVDSLVTNNRTARLVNDLDVRIADSSETYFPWVLDPVNPGRDAQRADNRADNVEQIRIDAPVAGKTYVVTVSHKGTLRDDSQDYALILSGIGGKAYCASTAASTQDSRIERVQAGSLDHRTTDSCTAYSDFTDLSADLEIGSDQGVDLRVTVGSCGETFATITKVFIDWNRDFDFDETDELVATSGVIEGNGTFSAQIFVPGSLAANTFTRMRIVTQETSDANDVQACGTYSKGETRDYGLQLVQPSVDVRPVSLVFPDSTACAGTQLVVIRLENTGTSAATSIPIRVTVQSNARTVATLTGTYQDTLATQQTGEITLTGTFDATANTAYTFVITTSLRGDQVSENNQLSTVVRTSAGSEPLQASAFACGDSTVTLVASGAGTAYWYDTATGGNFLAAGNQTLIGNAPVRDTYYVAANEFSGQVGAASKAIFSVGSYGAGFQPTPLITTYVPLQLDSARLYVGNSGKLIFTVETADGTVISTATVNVQTTRTPAQAGDSDDDADDEGAIYPLGLQIPEPGHYLIRMEYADGATIFRSNSGVTGFPYTIPQVISLDGAAYERDTLTNAYYYLYDIQVNALDCPGERVAVSVTEGEGITATVSAVGETAVCQGDSVTLIANSGEGLTYQWQRNGTAITSATAASYAANASGDYAVIVSNGQCISPPSKPILVTVTNLGKPTVTVTGQTLHSNSTSGNQWLLNGESISGATEQSYTAPVSGSYSVRVTRNGCSAVSDAVTLTVPEPEPEPPILTLNLHLQPNPTADFVEIAFTTPTETSTVSGKIYNVIGVQVAELTLEQKSAGTFQARLDVSALSAGLYVVEVTSQRDQLAKSFVKQ